MTAAPTTRLVLIGWRPGFGKIPFTKLVQKHTERSLAEAKHVTDALLEGGPRTIDFPDRQAAEDFRQAAHALGAIFR